MPLILLFIGAVFLISGVRGVLGFSPNGADLVSLIFHDLYGKDSFIFWIVAIAAIGSIGYIDSMKGFSHALLVLVIIVLVLAQEKKDGSGGFFTQFESAIKQIGGSS